MKKIEIPENLKQILVAVEELELWGENPRRGNVDAIKNSIVKYGWHGVVTYHLKAGVKTIYAGNHRFQAACELGMKEIPAVEASNLNFEEVQGYAYHDNLASDLAEYDDEALRELATKIESDQWPEMPDVEETSIDLSFLENVEEESVGGLKSVILTYSDERYAQVMGHLARVKGENNSDKIFDLLVGEA